MTDTSRGGRWLRSRSFVHAGILVLGSWASACNLARTVTPEEPDPTVLLVYTSSRGGFSMPIDGPIETRHDTVRIRETRFHRTTYRDAAGGEACVVGVLEPATGGLPLGDPTVQLRRVAEALWGGEGRLLKFAEALPVSGTEAFRVTIRSADETTQGRIVVAHARYYFFTASGGHTCAWERIQLLPALLHPTRPNERRAFHQTLTSGCEAGQADACFALAEMHLLGWGVEPNPEIISFYLRSACDFGHPWGCGSLGWWMIWHGDVAEARRGAEMLETACDRDDGLACMVLALAYQSGYGVSRNLGRAGELLKRGVDLGAWSPEQPLPEASDILTVLCDRGDMQFCPEERARH
jgi:TPR repeat protein